MAVCNYLLDGWLCGTRTLDRQTYCPAHGGETLAELHIQCTAPGGETGSYLVQPGRGIVSPVYTDTTALYGWCHANGWRILRDQVDCLTYIQDSAIPRKGAALKTARTSSAVEGITKPFDGPAMAEVAAKDYPPAVFPGGAA